MPVTSFARMRSMARRRLGGHRINRSVAVCHFQQVGSDLDNLQYTLGKFYFILAEVAFSGFYWDEAKRLLN